MSAIPTDTDIDYGLVTFDLKTLILSVVPCLGQYLLVTQFSFGVACFIMMSAGKKREPLKKLKHSHVSKRDTKNIVIKFFL